jgi:monooxygenase
VADVEHLDVLIVGAGLSGIGAGHYVQTDCPWAEYAIFEGRDAIGGTWDLFRYPGLRSDSDMFTLGYAFRPWDGQDSIADGEDILRYVKETAAAEGIDRKIRFGHRVTRADWSTDDGHWKVTAERTDTGATVELTAGWLFSCSGYYRYDQGYTPDFAGMDTYGGTIIHPQHWPADLDAEGKRVVVIGSGATAVTLVPALARQAEHVTMLQRSPTYIVSLPRKDPFAQLLRKVLPARWSGPIVRWFKALTTQASYRLSKWSPNLVRKVVRAGVTRQLPKGYDVDTHFNPRYDPWDQRLCVVPDGDLFRAIRKGGVDVVTDRIDTFTETGLRLESGTELAADIVVTATGLELLFAGGMALSVDGIPVDLPSLLTYKGMMLEGVPNFAIAIGYTNASWTLKCELTCQYVTRLLNHLHETGMRQCTPRNEDASVTAAPLLGLSSGYIQRSSGSFPKQGSRFPWQVHQSYLRDYRALRMASVVDDAMRFTNPSPEPSPVVGAGR